VFTVKVAVALVVVELSVTALPAEQVGTFCAPEGDELKVQVKLTVPE
jgi:hypothetical protein